ncbi:MAG: ATP-binding cassette domain-containing protein [Bacteroidota bacterium]
MKALLKIEKLGFCDLRQGSWVLQGVDLIINPGEIRVIYGGVGSGKTTLVELISGFKQPTRGRIERTEAYAVVAQEFDLYPDLTVAENLDFLSLINHSKVKGRQFLLSRYGLDGWERTRAIQLPGALKKMLQLAAAGRQEFELLVMDEPTVGLDLDLRRKFSEAVKELKGLGKGILILTANEADLALGEQVLELKNGTLSENSLAPSLSDDSLLETGGSDNER